MNNKLIYETPMSELILVRFEENILSEVLGNSGFEESQANVKTVDNDMWHWQN